MHKWSDSSCKKLGCGHFFCCTCLTKQAVVQGQRTDGILCPNCNSPADVFGPNAEDVCCLGKQIPLEREEKDWKLEEKSQKNREFSEI